MVTAEKMAAGGDALARLDDGRVIFVRGALPGETVEVRVLQSRKDYARGVVDRVVAASPDRVEPECPGHTAGCGGCDWIHLSPDAQRRLKNEVVREALVRTGRLADPVVVDGGAVAPWGYRSTMRLAVGDGGRLGLRAAASHRVVVLEGCPVAAPALSAMIPTVRASRDDDEVTLRPETWLEVGGVRLELSPESFSQSGPEAARLLVETVDSLVGEECGSGTFLDAYGGAGLFSATVGRRFDDVVLVEASGPACADARRNVPRAEVVCSPFEDWTPRPVEVAVVDPARSGLGRDAAAVLAATGVRRVVLVSCDPVAGARDIALLGAHGFGHRSSTVLDLFPQTHHVEVVSLLERP